MAPAGSRTDSRSSSVWQPAAATRSGLVDSAWPDLSDIDVVLVSDCGANTFLLGNATFIGGEPVPNKLVELAEFVRVGGWKNAREQGLARAEGKEYVVQDGDVMLFRFNV